MFQRASRASAFNAKSTWSASIVEAKTGALLLRNGQVLSMNIKYTGTGWALAFLWHPSGKAVGKGRTIFN